MGVYYYTLRSKEVRAKDGTAAGNGGTLNLAFFSYAYKCGCVDEYSPRGKFLLANVSRNRDAAWEKHAEGEKVPYVVRGDKPQNGLQVYKDVTGRGWYDTSKFPGEAYGYLVKKGGRWTVVDTYDDESPGVVGFETSVPVIGTRSGVKNGVHGTVGYYAKLPNGRIKYVACEDAGARAEVSAAWKPLNDAKKAERKRAEAKVNVERERARAKAKLKREALEKRKAELANEVAEVDRELRKLAFV